MEAEWTGSGLLFMGRRPKEPVVICPRCRRRMATKEHKQMGPKQRKAIRFTDSLVEVAYVCENCGTEIKRTIREKARVLCNELA
jgi:DNA-directed RNA polymerase subunit RPC12/RpoP